MSALGFKNSLGIHPQTMQLRASRAEILANNLANADTPNFKARDMDFNAVLEGESRRSLKMQVTDSSHLEGTVKAETDLLFRNPYQPAIDGNTVDSQMEQSFYTENALRYNASFEFLSSKFKGLKNAIKAQ
ncbi:flagellar basal body rod protein FlgB [Oceaniserpentilla sp. 4NH20-0058]|uniref:flagellar basal body rod protein FlgB n=1 Tax=Oceaniserpentilla sp. 4NH20-0058 TaxID=3127660 RepID=UPI003109A26C